MTGWPGSVARLSFANGVSLEDHGDDGGGVFEATEGVRSQQMYKSSAPEENVLP